MKILTSVNRYIRIKDFCFFTTEVKIFIRIKDFCFYFIQYTNMFDNKNDKIAI